MYCPKCGAQAADELDVMFFDADRGNGSIEYRRCGDFRERIIQVA